MSEHSIKDPNLQMLVDAGEHWKAKEKLQGQLAGCGYNTVLFEEYGNVLLAMHDKLEAGKYLFLSGVRHENYTESIALFLKRYSGKGSAHIFHTFPKNAQKAAFSDYPENVLTELEQLEFRTKDIKRNLNKEKYRRARQDRATEYGCLAFAAFIGILFLAGVFNGVRVMWGLVG